MRTLTVWNQGISKKPITSDSEARRRVRNNGEVHKYSEVERAMQHSKWH